jgi:DNA-binding NarL/FixJ family response regulator
MQTKIVLADDHRLVREGLRRLLEENDQYRVVGEASTGDEAVAVAAAQNPDVVVMDLTMPGISGIEATRRIRNGWQDTKVLVLSMHGNRSYVEEVFKAGASGYVLKDAAASDLIQAIDAVCEGETFLSPSITQHVVDALAAHRSGARGADADRRGALQQGDRRAARRLAQDRRVAPRQPDGQARHPQGLGARPLRHPRRPGRRLVPRPDAREDGDVPA